MWSPWCGASPGAKRLGTRGRWTPWPRAFYPSCWGKATRAASLLEDTSKEYRAEFAFGYATDTQDSTGEVLARSDVRVTKDALLAALPHFRGNILQEPSLYPARAAEVLRRAQGRQAVV